MLGEVEGYDIVSYPASELFDDATIKLVDRLWTYFLRHNWLKLTDWLVNFFLRIWVAPIAEALETGGYHDILEEISPDIIICTYDAFGQILGGYAQEKSIPFYMVITEISIFIDLVNPYATHICYFPETINAIRSFPFESPYFATKLDRKTTGWGKIKYVLSMYKEYILFFRQHSIYRNIDQKHPERNQAKCIAVGPIVEPVYYEKKNKDAMRQKYGIDRDTPCLLAISGSIGGSYLSEVVRLFQDNYSEPLTILVVCGQDNASYQQIESIQQRNPTIKIMPFGFIDYLNELYAAADVLIARPSAGVLLEALMSHLPIILPKKATSNDLGSIELVKKYELGQVYTHQHEVTELFPRIINRQPHYIENIRQFLAAYPANFTELKKVMQEIILPKHSG